MSPGIKALCDRMSPVLAGSRVLASQACYRPVTQDGLPLIGAIPGVPGVYVATGHGVWGILNAPATGEAVAELILDGAASTVDLSPFDPARLPVVKPELPSAPGSVTDELSVGLAETRDDNDRNLEREKMGGPAA
jgi:hypothetical protein